MTYDTYTLIVVPHAKARFRKFQVQVRLVKWTAGVAGALAIVAAGMLFHYTRIAVEVAELRQLREENQVLTARTQEYEQNAGKLQAKVSQLQGLVTKLGVMAGLEQAPPSGPSIAGVGGVSGFETSVPTSPSLHTMDQNLTALTEKSQKLEAFYRDQTVLLASTPSVWPVRGYLSASFGNRQDPFTGGRDFHPGLDISSPMGTRVQAPADGLVVSANVQGGYGNAIVIDHGYGVVTRYGHLSGFNVRPGQRVHRGEVIGFVGNTGRSTGPHLHYEVWVRDQAQNPIHYILDEYRTFG
jgi:murein DD-endopeptidase MepM/ murein hydrolase activator NlpD